MLKGLVLACGLAAGVASAQEAGAKLWEIGMIGGYGYSPSLSVDGRSGSADAGLKRGAVVGVFGGNDTYNYWSGEARYMYRFSDLKLSSGSTEVSFGGHTHILTGDILGHFRPRTAHIRPFIAFGGGVKLLKGTGVESAAQPLGRFAALTHTQETQAVADLGFGVKVNWRKSWRLRFEVHDYISHSPTKVIAAAPGAAITGAMNDIQGMVAASYTW